MEQIWERTTRVCPPIDLRPELLDAIRAHVDAAELGSVEADALVCFETEARCLKKPGLLMRLAGAAHRSIIQAVIVTPTRLVWAQRHDDEEPFARSQLLARLDVTDFEKGPGGQLLPDHGLEVSGIPSGDGRSSTVFFGLGEGPDADRARVTFKEAVRAAQGEAPTASSAGAAPGVPDDELTADSSPL